MRMRVLCIVSALILGSVVSVSAVPGEWGLWEVWVSAGILPVICTLSLSSLAPPDDECNDEFPARENCEFDEVCEDAFCRHNEYVTCHMNRCGTCEAVFRGYDNLTVSCNELTPKCRLMHLEMLNKRRTGTILPGGRLDIDAGVRVTDKTGDDPKCDRLVRVHLIEILFTFKVEFTPLARTKDAIRRQLVFKLVKEYTLDTTQILEINIEERSHVVSIRLTENGTKDPVDVATVAHYIERDLKNSKFGLEVDGRSLEVERDSIKVLFFDNEPPRMNMKTISPGFAAIIIVIALAILTGIAVFVVVRRRAEQEKKRFQFEVIEGQGQDDYHMAQRETMAYFVM
ncbi:epithelial cell adhesion molecule-like isoform X2 [Brienomyrus brachyistius]|uniref:epithelial cell adhesion molecule-like isoform X2 n=1 Tax=Brienomyrus brachyistius TaxID=42636 RepID=UPI0020B3DDDF|nr:epithelial cell adhesion molecule-like isoform X2 [Brienomyrus brachyistius]